MGNHIAAFRSRLCLCAFRRRTCLQGRPSAMRVVAVAGVGELRRVRQKLRNGEFPGSVELLVSWKACRVTTSNDCHVCPHVWT